MFAKVLQGDSDLCSPPTSRERHANFRARCEPIRKLGTAHKKRVKLGGEGRHACLGVVVRTDLLVATCQGVWALFPRAWACQVMGRRRYPSRLFANLYCLTGYPSQARLGTPRSRHRVPLGWITGHPCAARRVAPTVGSRGFHHIKDPLFSRPP